MEKKGERIEIQLMPEEVFLTQGRMLNFPMHFVSPEARGGVRWLWGSDEITEFADFENAYPDKAVIIERAATEWYTKKLNGILDYETLIDQAGPELYFAYSYLSLAGVPLSDIKG